MSLESFQDLVEGVAISEEYFEMPPSHQVLRSALLKSKFLNRDNLEHFITFYNCITV